MSDAFDLIVRPATTADVLVLNEHVQRAYRGEASRAGWTTEADYLEGQRTDPEELTSIISSSDRVILLAESGSELLASCEIDVVGELAHFGMFAVRPDRQGGGVGRRLLAEAESYAVSVFSSVAMELYVIAQRDELVAWYARRGYQLTGKRVPFPYGNARLGIPLRDDLEFVVMEKRLSVDQA